MKCPDEGKLLLYLENQLSQDEYQDTANHLTNCSVCSARLAELRENYDFTAHNLAGLWENQKSAPVTGQQKVWQQIQTQQQFNKRGVRAMKTKKFAIAAALVLALTAIGSMPAIQTAAANLLQIFRVEQVDTLTMTPGDIQKIEQAIYDGAGSIDIEDFGSVQSVGESGAYKIESQDLAGLDFPVKVPSLTDESATAYSLQKTPSIEVRPKVESVNELLKMLGSSYKLPAALDGQICKFKMGDALVSTYHDYELIQGPVPEIEVPDGVNVKEVARAMVALPIWPENIRTQLESVGDWEHTLLIPDENPQKVSINGTQGVLLDHETNRALVWQEDGMLYILQSQLEKADNLAAIAESLR
ncbi:MAG TPA: DUF4367 domain-containing protein [Syntrophomonas sp.]|nr:DUF4367 domain-containing protein [Syntrophomonas sp.]